MRHPGIVKSHKKMLQNIKKKAFELSTLCGVDVCVVSSSADGRKVDTWPENPNELKVILKRYKEHQSKLKKSNAGVTNHFQGNACSSSTTEDILSLFNKLSSNSLRIFSNQITAKIEMISNRIDVLSLPQSLFYGDEMDCNVNQSNPSLNFENDWWSFAVDNQQPMPETSVNISTAFSDVDIFSELPDLAVNNQYNNDGRTVEAMLPWVEEGHHKNVEKFLLHPYTISQEISSNLIKEHNEISNEDITLMMYEGAPDGFSSLISSDEIQFSGQESEQFSEMDELLGSSRGPYSHNLSELDELLDFFRRSNS